VFLALVTATILWLRPGPEDRLVGRWVLDEAAWSAADPLLSTADAALREAVLDPPRRLPLSVVFGPGPAFSMALGDRILRGQWRVLAVKGDRVVAAARLSGDERELVADVGWGRCVLDVGLGHPLPLLEVR
jgi:hypothetical protein